eukprot:7404956-Ditylum_brightwellii.AAC.1
MGLYNVPDIFQEKISEMFTDIKEVHACIDGLLLLTNGRWGHHLEKLDTFVDRLKCVELKKKVKAIIKITPPTTRKQ